MRKRRIITLIIAVCILFISTGNAYASYTTLTETTNVVTIGHVRIQLNNTDQETGKTEEENTTSAGTVLPGSKIEKKVSISNTGTYSAYVRVYLEKYWEDRDGKRTNHLELDKIIIHPANKDWVYNPQDGYFYYQKELLPTEETPLLIDGFQISEDIDATIYSGYKGNMEVYGEAVQYEDFFESLEKNDNGEIIGWGDMLNFEDKQGNSEGQINPLPSGEKDKIVHLKIEENGEATVSSTNLFPNFNGTLPGNKIEQRIELKNRNKITKKIFLHAEPYLYETEEQKDIAEALLNDIIITVEQVEDTGNNTIIYSGALAGKNTASGDYNMVGEENRILLGEFPQNKSSLLLVTLKIPSDWDVDNSETKIKWIFSTMDGEKQTPVPSATPYDKTTKEPTSKPVTTMSPEPSATPYDKTTKKPTSKPVITMSPVPTMVNTKGPLSEINATPIPQKSMKPITTRKPYSPPKTGDSQNFFFWCISSGVAFLVLMAMAISLIKEKEKK